VTTDAPEEALAYAADAATGLAAGLAAHPSRTFKDAYGYLSTYDELAVFADRAALTGQSNPLSPPMTLAMEDDVAVGIVTFGPPFEGVPGCVHGGMVAAAFDQVFGYLHVRRGVGSLTGSLTVRYLRTTPLQQELRIEARIDRVEGRKSFVTARLLTKANGSTEAGTRLTAEADAVFVALDAAGMKAVIAKNTKG
jgi:acyl-coenzyme A thioesterase PaaI-like protein